MRKLVGAINMTLDGFCDHTAVSASPELHHHYKDLLNNANTILYGRITYQLMEFWPTIIEKPTGDKAMDEFALAMDKISKVVFSSTLKEVTWKSARIAGKELEQEVLELKHQPGGNILVGSPSLIVSALNLNLLDELQLCVHPVVAGNGLPLFKNIMERHTLTLVKTKTFGLGAITLYYESIKKQSL